MGLRFGVRREEGEDHTICTVKGDLDLHSKSELERQLEDINGKSKVIIDLTEATHLDGETIKSLQTYAERFRKHGKETIVVVRNGVPRRILSILLNERYKFGFEVVFKAILN